MRTLGFKILAFFYLGLGGVLGEFVRAVVKGKAGDWYHDSPGLAICTALGNVVGIGCLVMLFKKRAAVVELEKVGTMDILLKGLPINDRVAFLLFTSAWVIGLVFGFLMSL